MSDRSPDTADPSSRGPLRRALEAIMPAPAPLSQDEVFAIVRSITVKYLGAKPETVGMASRFEEIAPDSLDRIEVVMAIEEEFDLKISDDDVRRLVTIGDVVGYVIGQKAGR